MTTCPAPSASTDTVYPRRVAAVFCASCLSFDSRRLRSACNLSVPLCLGMTRSISSRQAIFSAWVLACLKRCSADIYWGVRLAGITILLSKSVWRYYSRFLGWLSRPNCTGHFCKPWLNRLPSQVRKSMAYSLPAEEDAVCVPRHVREALALHLE